jgi:hypothetical protein
MAPEPPDQVTFASGERDTGFSEFIRRVRGGDERAAVRLVERSGPAIRRAVRLRLRDPELQRLIESVDIGQSVFASFFVRTALGQYDLKSPDQLPERRHQVGHRPGPSVETPDHDDVDLAAAGRHQERLPSWTLVRPEPTTSMGLLATQPRFLM